ncbi:hypothetical protein NC651_000486 [Populus alba x Populus x berolinensis]|nr:hypothetical protein NC651_000486 [Populus alba x Populus x berolinensis]
MMTTPVTNVLFLALALAFFGLSAIDSAQARTLPDRFGLKVAKTLATPPPPCLVHSSKSKESTREYQKYLTSPSSTTSYDQETLSSPPRPDSTKGQLDIESPCSNEESPCINDGCISMTTDFERPIPSSNPPPKSKTPTVPLLRPKSPPGHYIYLESARNHHA